MEDIIVNSEFMYFFESPVGLTNAPVITDGYYFDDDGELENHEDADLYWFPNYMVTSFVEELKEKGEVFFTKAS